ncbi:glutamine-synthetase adenylyltransferase [Sulfitobacter sp. SK012]|uniref:bifunctional [glutamine synthetase] adenylyltransferase/[glutamine synthetase]-adenylyl-L-tyrosine phosphorylase n=1 Tax=Sulfitobacter sp. SK012 TaxID=1389005 RepID=UPI000E0BE1D8|nr:bifunctional [glutamine synthetase] adenylyltransferase/[glutamine synthetase]-adenylyl-L-tyrosine phosphorylase [Sulfitobacter sp. SK012]AXI46900.1 glutamine-synthetase adenylyltransferase [Sulfitobacter sp. SK012]
MTDVALSRALTRCPRIFNKARAEDAQVLAAGFDPALHDAIIGMASTSPYLMQLLTKEIAWLEAAVNAPKTALASQIAALPEVPPDQLANTLRQGKRRMALLTALADLGGAWSLAEVTGALTDYADAACGAALRAGVAAQIKRGKLPGMTEDDLEQAGGMVVLAMGKMGAHELNYSSDIDLICLFDETRFEHADFHDARAALIKATRTMSGLLSDLTAEGYVFRTDLRLRPDPAVTPVCLGMEAAERYYESLGRTWERAAYIKARPCAGDIAAGDRFLEGLRPFVWRRHLDFAAIQDAHDMRLAIREHKGLGGPITLPGHNMKLGRGGIREIEFFTQTRQLIAGGRDAELRVRGTVQGLSVLAAKDWVPDTTSLELADHYTFHRTVEHRMQMVQDAQTHQLPKTDEGFDRLAAMMDRDVTELRTELTERLGAVHGLTEGFFAASRATPEAEPPEHVFDAAVLDRWPSYPALRSERGSAIFERLKPTLLAKLAEAGKPAEALLAFDGFLAGLPAGVQLFSLLRANPQLSDLLIDIVTASPALATYLARNAAVLDAVIGGDFFSEWPGQATLTENLTTRLEAEQDYESQLDSARVWAREWHFRIGVHHLRGLTDAQAAGVQYSDLARAVLAAIWPVVITEFSRRFGPPPGQGAVILGMGSLGAGQLTATSDLDVIVIYDPADVEASTGPRSLPSRQYYARLTQAMITAMTAPMSQGRLYEVDMRLRPSGTKGPVATSFSSFCNYQQSEAWVWEHLALTRAQVVAGPDALAKQVEAFRLELLSQKRNPVHILSETAQMRERIAAAKSPAGVLDAKIGPGRLQDIELFAQAATLIAGAATRDIPSGIAAAESSGLLGPKDTEALQHAYTQAWALQSVSRLLSATPLEAQNLGQAARSFIIRALSETPESDTLADLEALLSQRFDAAAQIITSALGAPKQENEP